MNEFTTSRSSTYISSSNVPMKDRPPPLTSIETLELLQAGVHGTQGAVACGRAMATSPFHSLREPDVSLQDYFKTRIINYTGIVGTITTPHTAIVFVVVIGFGCC
eukprot:GHVQ01041190.1.p1 GENE.GHVQ01041190.1~~GHVQ01041190.1.p1  ORF type:complete len:105 (+),score=21.50 GHVQ01041190.1:386-700(+)